VASTCSSTPPCVVEAYSLEADQASARAERDVDTNLLGSLRMTRLALPYLRRAVDLELIPLDRGRRLL